MKASQAVAGVCIALAVGGYAGAHGQACRSCQSPIDNAGSHVRQVLPGGRQGANGVLFANGAIGLAALLASVAGKKGK